MVFVVIVVVCCFEGGLINLVIAGAAFCLLVNVVLVSFGFKIVCCGYLVFWFWINVVFVVLVGVGVDVCLLGWRCFRFNSVVFLFSFAFICV